MKLEMDKIQLESRREIEDLMLALEEALEQTKSERSREVLTELQDKLYTMWLGW